MNIKSLLFILLSFFISQNALAAEIAKTIDWSAATTSYPSDQSLGDTGHEKTPNGYVDLTTGNVVFDIPEVTLKGHRGLDFTLSRSYGKVNNGFRSMANWELEVPRLVMITAPSTKLQGDSSDGGGVCNKNGDATTDEPVGYAPLYRATFNSFSSSGKMLYEILYNKAYPTSDQLNKDPSLDTVYTVVDKRNRPISLYLPGQQNRTFYPVNSDPTTYKYPANAKYISQDNWYISCIENGKGFVVHASNGTTYNFKADNRESQVGYPSLWASDYIPGRVTFYADKVSNQFGESYALNYFTKDLDDGVFYSSSSKKFFLKSVQHQINKINVNTNPELQLTYIKKTDTNDVTESNFDNYSGDIVLKSINRLVKGNMVTWASYVYVYEKKYGYGSFDEYKDKQSAQIYLTSAGYINGDATSYDYKGPYRLVGNAIPTQTGVTGQNYLWFYSDLTKVRYFKPQANSTAKQEIASTTWTYTKIDIPRPNFDETSSYRVTQSDISLVSNAKTQKHTITYVYEKADYTTNEQKTTVTAKDVDYNFSKTFVYSYYAYEKGIKENERHGLLKSIVQGDRTETYAWAITGATKFGLRPSSANYITNDLVQYMRLKSKTVNHHGFYSTTYDTFDGYGNPKKIVTKGFNGELDGTAYDRTVEQTFFNADYTSTDVEDGTYPWLVGLPASEKVSTFNNFTTTYDNYGAVTTDTRGGVTTTFKYETTSFFGCLGKLASFEWSGFVNCLGDYAAGVHSGLVIEKNVGNGELVTHYANYKFGIPQNIKNPNGGVETNTVDDVGNITQHVDADKVTSRMTYDSAGRIRTEIPVYGLAPTVYSYYGLTTTKNTNDGEIIVEELTNASGQVVYQSTKAGDKTIYSYQDYDTFGNLRKASDPLTANTSSPTYKVTNTYDEFDRIKTSDDHGNKNTYCYQKCDSVETGAYTTVTNSNGEVLKQWYYALGDFNTDRITKSIQTGADGTTIESTVSYNKFLLKPSQALSGTAGQGYTYDTNGLLLTEQDSISVKSHFSYDSAGRINKITYTDFGDKLIEEEQFSYTDKVWDKPSSRSLNGQTINYSYSSAGRLKESKSSNVTLSYGLDSYGRINKLTQSINGDNSKKYIVSYSYNKLSQVTGITYPNGQSIDLTNQNAFGEVSTIPNVLQAISYNEYHQPTRIQANDDVAWDLSYTAGKLTALNTLDVLGNCRLKLIYTYDTKDRLNKITDQCGGSYTAILDRYGNGLLKKATMGQGSYEYSYNGYDISSVKTAIKQGSNVVTTNYDYTYTNSAGTYATKKLENISNSSYKFTYDKLGRATHDGIRALAYDAFGRATTVGSDRYIYAPDNLRARAIRSSETVDYVYGLDGELLVETNLTTGLVRNFVYLAGQQVATLERFTATDSDGDGLSDLEEQELGLDPNHSGDAYNDTDDDGLPDYLERYLGLNPNKEDTDGDGFRDGYEYKTLGLRVALDKNMYPSTPEPEEDLSWLPAVMSLLLDDEEA